jgi:AcrR family transcriptional regulator
LTLERVANCTNVSIQTIYYHFKSLSSLIAFAQLRRLRRVADELSSSLEQMELLDQDAKPVDYQKIVQAVFTVAWSVSEFRDLVDALGDIQCSPMAAYALTNSIEDNFRRWVRAINAAQTRSQIRDCR